MKNLLMLCRSAVKGLFIFSSCMAGVDANEINSVLIKTIDINNQPIKAEAVKWWFSNTPQKENIMECKQLNCSEWLIQNRELQAIDIYAYASKVKKDDPYCWDLFEGGAKNQTGRKIIYVTLTYSSTVCK